MDSIEKLLYGLAAMSQGYKGERIAKTRVGDYTVSTIDTPDQGWETAIWKQDGEIVLVARYETREEAQIGHNDWICACKLNPTVAWSIQFDQYITL